MLPSPKNLTVGHSATKELDVEDCYGNIIQLSAQLEGLYKNIKTYKDTFEQEFVELNNEILQQINAFFTHFHTVDFFNTENGKKCADILWKNVYYNNYRQFKLNQANASEEELNKFRYFLLSGIGHYHSLIFNLQATFNLKELNFVSYFRTMPISLKNYQNSDDHFFNFGVEKKQYDFGRNQRIEFKQLLLYLFGRFFTCLGDLSRYYMDCFPEDVQRSYFHQNAVFFYKCASLIESNSGMPFNQLATLYKNNYHGLDSLFYYTRSVKSAQPFFASAENIKKFFGKLKTLDGKRYLSVKTNQEYTERALQAFLSFYSVVQQGFETSKFNFGQEYSVMMTATVDKISKILSIQKSSNPGSSEKPEKLGSDSLLKILSLVFITMEDLQKDIVRKDVDFNPKRLQFGTSGSFLPNDKSPFLLNILLQFVFELVSVLVHQEKKQLEKTLPHILGYEETRDAIARDLCAIDNVQYKKKPKIKCDFSFSSDPTGDEDAQAIDTLKSTAINSIVDLFDHPEIDNCINEYEQFANIAELEEEPASENSSEVDFSSHTKFSTIPREVRNFVILLDKLYTNNFTPVIKMFCDFIEINPHIVKYGVHCQQFNKFFESFYQYLDLLSELDYKIVTGFNHFFSNVDPEEKTENLFAFDSFVNEQRKIRCSEFREKFPPGIFADFMRITKSSAKYYEKKFKFDNLDIFDAFYEHVATGSPEEMSHSCIRALLNFGINFPELANITVSFENLNHNLEEHTFMKFKYQTVKPSQLQSELKPVEIKQEKTKKLFKPQDVQDREVAQSAAKAPNRLLKSQQGQNSERSFKVLKKGEELPASTASKSSAFSKPTPSFVDLSNLNFLLLDPFVFLDDLNFVKKIAKRRKAFIVVPRIVIAFLDKLKSSGHEKGTAASEYLSNEFLKGTRIFKFLPEDHRLRLPCLNYQEVVWNRELPVNDQNGDHSEEAKTQAYALFLELLEICYYLLVNKVFENRCDQTSKETRIALVTNDSAKLAQDAIQLGQAFNIDVMTTDDFDQFDSSYESKPSRAPKRNPRNKNHSKAPLRNNQVFQNT